MIYLTKL